MREPINIEILDDLFRVKSTYIQTDWFLDTYANRKAIAVFLLSLKNKYGRRLFTLQESNKVLNVTSRQGVHHFWKKFVSCGRDIVRFLKIKDD